MKVRVLLRKATTYLSLKGVFDFLPDDKFLKMRYYLMTGKKLDLDAPKTFNEKLQWLKINDRCDEYTAMVDKYQAKEYVAKKIGAEHIIPTYKIWDNADDIDLECLPESFVIKCTHDSKNVLICKDKTKVNQDEVKKQFEKGLKREFYRSGREWPYKNVKPRIIVEEQMKDPKQDETGLVDYKIYCFNGEPKYILVCQNRYSGKEFTEDFYSVDWEKLNLKRADVCGSEEQLPRPEKLEEMLSYARILSESIPFLRTDFYIIKDVVFFGELTFYPTSGFEDFEPNEYNSILGNLLKLPNE